MLDELRGLVRDIPDHPQPGVIFKDITPLLGDAEAFRFAIDGIAAPFAESDVSHVVGIEARGFIVAAPVAHQLRAGFVPVRKPGKLPWHTMAQEYALEYGTDTLELHVDGVGPDDRVLIVDDVLATGGTAQATAALVAATGATVVGLAFLIELEFLNGRSRLIDHKIASLLRY
jgi:adenine phosphoribosyltransferase